MWTIMTPRIVLFLFLFLFTFQYAYAAPHTTISNLLPEPQEQTVQQFLEQMEKKANASTYRLYYMKDLCVGSAWVLKTNGFRGTVLVTATHCLIDSATKKLRGNFWHIGHPSWDPEKKLQFKLLVYNELSDVAVLFSTERYELDKLTISSTSQKFPDPLFVMANSPPPPQFPNLLPELIIGNYLCTVVVPKTNEIWDLITNYTRPGCSGAPVLNVEGNVVGIIHGWIAFGSNGFMVRTAISRNILIKTIESAGIVPFLNTPSDTK